MDTIRALISFFVQLDQRILDVLESLCHRQQRFFGVTHYFWLRLDAIVISAATGAFIYPSHPVEERWKLVIFISMLLVAGIFGYPLWEKVSYRRITKGFGNPLRKSLFGMYIRMTHCYFLVVLYVVFSIEHPVFILIAFGWFMFSILYVLPACDPLPPTPGKVKEWLQKQFARTHAA